MNNKDKENKGINMRVYKSYFLDIGYSELERLECKHFNRGDKTLLVKELLEINQAKTLSKKIGGNGNKYE